MQPSRNSQVTPSQGQPYTPGSNGSNTDEPANEELLRLLAEKRKELEGVTQVNRASEDLAIYFKDLADNLSELSKGSKGIADIVKNWDDAFMIMGLTTKENKKKNELFRYVKE